MHKNNFVQVLTGIEVDAGLEGLCRAATYPDVDLVMSAVVGAIGLPAPCASAFSLASGTQCARRHHGLTRSGAGLKSGLFCLSPSKPRPKAAAERRLLGVGSSAWLDSPYAHTHTIAQHSGFVCVPCAC
jgi:hypothetical protein